MPDSKLDWNGDPLLYKRKEGFGLVLRGLHYRFTAEGHIEEVSPVTRPVLEFLTKELYPNPGMAMASGLSKKEEKKDG